MTSETTNRRIIENPTHPPRPSHPPPAPQRPRRVYQSTAGRHPRSASSGNVPISGRVVHLRGGGSDGRIEVAVAIQAEGGGGETSAKKMASKGPPNTLPLSRT